MADLRDDIKAVLVNNGVDIDGGSFHSWRCFDKERYPEPCTCTDDVVTEVMVVVDAAVTAARMEQEAHCKATADAAVAAAEQRSPDHIWHTAIAYADYLAFQRGVKAAREVVAAYIRADLTEQEMFSGRKSGILAAIDAPCDCGTCRAIAADRLTRGKEG